MSKQEDFENDLAPIRQGIEAPKWGEFWLELFVTTNRLGEIEFSVGTDYDTDYPREVFECESLEALQAFLEELSRNDEDEEMISEFIRDQIEQTEAKRAERYRPRSARQVAAEVQARA